MFRWRPGVRGPEQQQEPFPDQGSTPPKEIIMQFGSESVHSKIATSIDSTWKLTTTQSASLNED